MRNALIGLGVAALVICGVVAVPAAAAPAGQQQHVIVLLRDQHPQTPATRASVGQRAAAVTPIKRRCGGTSPDWAA